MGSDSDRGPDATSAGPETVVLTGAAGALGRRVCDLLVADPEVSRVIAIDRRPLTGLPSGVEPHQLDLAAADLTAVSQGPGTVLHLAQADRPAAEAAAPHPGDG